jgi:hypothetical protein
MAAVDHVLLPDGRRLELRISGPMTGSRWLPLAMFTEARPAVPRWPDAGWLRHYTPVRDSRHDA